MKKIVVRVPQWLGDAVVSTVFIRELKRLESPCEISVLCPPALSSLFISCPGVSNVIPLEYKLGKTVLGVARGLQENGFDEMYVLPRSLRTALEAGLSQIPSRIGFKNGLASMFFTKTVERDENLLYAQIYLKMIDKQSLTGLELIPYFPSHDLPTHHLLHARLQNLSGPVLGIAPCSVAPARTWFGDRFRAIAEKFLAGFHGSIIFFGSEKESAAIENISRNLSQTTINTAGKLSLPELGNVIKKCQIFLGNDSGLMHVASAFSIPSVIVFGPSRPEHALPPVGNSVAKRYKELFCVPCEKNECVRFGSEKYECLAQISVDAVFAEIVKRVEKTR